MRHLHPPLFSLLAVFFFSLASASPCPLSKLYHNVSQVIVRAETEAHLDVLRYVLSHPCHSHMLAPETPALHTDHFLQLSHLFLRTYIVPNFDPSLVHVNLKDYGPVLEAAPYQRTTPAPDFYTRYYALHVLQHKWRSFSTPIVYGRSIEQRDLQVIVLESSRQCTNSSAKYTVLLNALQHAREWATSSSATFVAEYYSQHLDELPECCTLAVVPVSNPDGYAFTAVENRLWRKNRRPGTPCDGVDLNRNWDINYAGAYSTSNRTCSNEYIGTGAFSEPESSALRDLFLTLKPVAHIDLHSFGQDLLGAYQFSPVDVAHAQLLDEVASEIQAVASAKYSYSRSSKGTVLYAASGFFSDWSFSQGCLSYTMEVSPGSGNLVQGFFPDEATIKSTANDVLQAVKVLIKYASVVGAEGNLTQMSEDRDAAILAQLKKERTVSEVIAPIGRYGNHDLLIYVGWLTAFIVAAVAMWRVKSFGSAKSERQSEESTALLP